MEERTAQARVRRAARVRPRERPRSESSPEPVPEPRVEPAPQPAAPRRRLPAVEGLAMVIGGLLAFGMIGDAYRDSVGQAPTVIPGLVIEGVEVGGLTREALLAREAELSERGLSRVITLAGPGGVAIETTARDLGAVPAFTEAVDEALALGRTGSPLRDLQDRARARRGELSLTPGQRFDEARALAHLQALAPQLARPPLPTRFDLEARTILPAAPGATLLPYDSLSAVAIGLAAGEERIDLIFHETAPADDPLAEIAAGLDISTVLGTFATPYHQDAAARDRVHNLEVGAARLDGHVLMPGEEFSFNDVVGDRSYEAGFRYAPGITQGELVDVVGGGICQVSSTLFGAAFFAGLEIVHARPHSRPSSYVDMGLDSTVVYPTVDMKLKNPHPFPVVLHVAVSAGEIKVEVLGARRDFKVAFEREIVEVLPFTTLVRNDDRLRTGTRTVSQQGKRGFKVIRRRKVYGAGDDVRVDEWELRYPPTREIVRVGTSPTGQVPEAKPTSALRDPASELRIVQ